jgi:membrane-bound serine protease (ClpP class)
MDFYLLLIITLILFGIALMLAELAVVSYGGLAIAGLVIFTIGIVMLVSHDLLSIQTASSIIIGVTVANLIFIFFTIGMAIKTRARKIVSGQEALIGQTAIVESNFDTNQGWVRLGGELWRACAEVKLKQGEQVQVIDIKGLLLFVKQPNKGIS